MIFPHFARLRVVDLDLLSDFDVDVGREARRHAHAAENLREAREQALALDRLETGMTRGPFTVNLRAALGTMGRHAKAIGNATVRGIQVETPAGSFHTTSPDPQPHFRSERYSLM